MPFSVTEYCAIAEFTLTEIEEDLGLFVGPFFEPIDELELDLLMEYKAKIQRIMAYPNASSYLELGSDTTIYRIVAAQQVYDDTDILLSSIEKRGWENYQRTSIR